MTTPTHVLLLCWRDTRHPQGGGSETYLEHVGAELVRRGRRVTYLTASYPGAAREEWRDGMRFLRVGGRISVYPRVMAILLAGRLGRGPLADAPPDLIVDTQNGVPFFASVVSTAPTVVLVHHCHREQWPVAGLLLGRLGWFIESVLSPRVHRRNHYVTVSTPSAEELDALGVDRHRISVVHNGIDPVPEGHADVAAPNKTHLCVLSRLVPHKQVEDALIVVVALRREHPDLHLDVIGDGWWSDRLHEKVSELGIADAVTFHGHVDDPEKHRLLARSAVHLMPSAKEGWGLAVIEAAQHHTPTIGYRAAGGLAESIDDGQTGLLVDGIDELISATRKLVDDPDLARRLGAAAAAKAQGYSWQKTCDGMVSVLDAAREAR